MTDGAREGLRRAAVTGASGYIGARLVRRLEQEDSVEKILAIDVRPPARPFGSKTVFMLREASGAVDRLLSEHAIDSVSHLAFILKPGRNRASIRRTNVEGARNMLEGCARASVEHLLYLSSSTVYGAHPDNPSLLTESSPLRPVEGFQYGEDKAAAESVIQNLAKRPGSPATVVLRACPVLGPTADNYVSRSFSGPFLVRIRGADPPMQFLHEDDLTELMAHCILNRVSGVYNAAGDGTITWREATDRLGRTTVSVPAGLIHMATDLSWRLRLQTSASPAGLRFIRYPWVVSTEKIKREVGIGFRYSSGEAWEVFARHLRG